jgi:Na+-transporting NADH:ubiquinone oxidoreductase subunit F
VRRVPNGICTTWVFDHLREGQAVSFSGPYGNFRLSGGGVPALFIAGGSGMAPILSMLRRMAETKDFRKAVFFFGAQTQRDLFLTEEITGFEKALPDFRFVPALSREPEGGGWQGERGLVTAAVGRRLPDISAFEAYLCGSPGMIDACIRTLKAGGIPEDRIYYDKF